MQFNLAIESLTAASHFDSPQTIDYHASIRQTSTTPKRDAAISPNKISPYPRWNFPPSWSIKLQLFPLSITCSTDLQLVIYAHKSLSISRLHWHGFHKPPERIFSGSRFTRWHLLGHTRPPPKCDVGEKRLVNQNHTRRRTHLKERKEGEKNVGIN